ncbi:nucleotide-diphospho-sugar transferases superfamily protein [Actinidia rufa]|uniref:dolichyl-phosphate beta-glucosyltransferase n=1 Tax=Actinidia rufa TaxID=165716 RepID=A0A7J0ECM4_9ERIC|nr:nucleotide-diphospho-sugar transferases superfamily protein [Actinidia rufa]
MEFLWSIFEFIVIVALVSALALGAAIVFEAFRRRFNHTHAEGHPIFEDPSSLKQVPCPYIFDPAEKYISLIIPAFNEEHRLPGALDETLNYLQQRAAKDKSFSYEVVIVDDGSADGTKRVAFDFVKKCTVENVRVILLGKNHGKGEAIRKGMLHSRGELLLMLDADGATKVDDLEKLENQIRTVARRELGDSSDSDSSLQISDFPIAAFGSRAHLEDKALATDGALDQPAQGRQSASSRGMQWRPVVRWGWWSTSKGSHSFGQCSRLDSGELPILHPSFNVAGKHGAIMCNHRKWYRNFLMKGFHLVVLLAAGPGIRDTQCGFKMFTRAAARKLFTSIRLKRWCFDVELVYLCKYFGIPVIEISVNWCEIPGSKVNLLSIPNMLWELVLMSVGYRTGMWKICT